ncbi:hypothetical protein CASFOL_040308 [Castilleja foliolosa]|uniref:RNase H type-1 domain-containing protein n=1 Tax=Castilleja foliolosa TaxID=1961234 RepID=A0ABD3BFH7_9LAMI
MFTLKIHTVDYPQPLHTTCTPTTSGGSAAGPNSNNNQKPVELMGVAHLFRQLPSANQPAVTVTNISARTTLIFVVAVPNYLSENDFLIFCGNHVSYFEEIIFLKVSALEDGARFVARARVHTSAAVMGRMHSRSSDFTVFVSVQAMDHWKSILQIWQTPPPLQHWKPLGEICLKANSDSSFKDGKATASIIIKNSNGSIIFASTATSHCLNSLSAECLAILHACKTLEKLKIKQATWETDSLNAATLINRAWTN